MTNSEREAHPTSTALRSHIAAPQSHRARQQQQPSDGSEDRSHCSKDENGFCQVSQPEDEGAGGGHGGEV